jgi:hypothetical protein
MVADGERLKSIKTGCHHADALVSVTTRHKVIPVSRAFADGGGQKEARASVPYIRNTINMNGGKVVGR